MNRGLVVCGWVRGERGHPSKKDQPRAGDLSLASLARTDLALARAEHLEGQNVLGLAVPRHRLAVQDERLDARFGRLHTQMRGAEPQRRPLSSENARPPSLAILFETHRGHAVDEVRVLAGQVLRVAAKDHDLPVLELVDLVAFAVVLVLAGEPHVLKAVQHFGNALGRVREHGLDRNACARK